MWRKVSELVSLRFSRPFSFSSQEDKFKLASCQKLMKKLGAELLASAEVSGRSVPHIPDVYFQSKKILERGVEVWSAYSDASGRNYRTQPDVSIASAVFRNGIPQLAMIASFRGRVTSVQVERIGVEKSNWLVDHFFNGERCEMFTDCEGVSNSLKDAIKRMRADGSLPLTEEQYNIMAAKMIVCGQYDTWVKEEQDNVIAAHMIASGHQIGWVSGKHNIIPHFLAEYAKIYMPPQVITKPFITAADVTNVRVFSFDTMYHNTRF